jgi:hypothetical protein
MKFLGACLLQAAACLFDAQRHPKFVIACSYPELVPSGATEYSPEDAVYYQ